MSVVCRISFLACVVLAASGSADPGDSVDAARQMAFNGHRPDALQMLDRLLKEGPDSDALVLRGMILSWEGRYDEARRDLEKVLAQHPDHGDALPALINVEMWSDHPERAERLTREALRRHPNDPDLMLAHAKALRSMKREHEALAEVRHLLEVAPDNHQAYQMESSLADSMRDWTASIDHSSEWFSDGRTPWSEEQVQLSRQTPEGSVIARFDHADRFSSASQQMELDMYPHIREGTYAYLNVGYSPDANLYPRYRAAADLYQSLGHGYELTGGMRLMHFGDNVRIYTAALTKYRGDWMLTSRVYLTPDIVGTSRSVQLQARRYIGGSSTDYWSVRLGYGSSPTEVVDLTDIQILNSASFASEFVHTLNKRLQCHLEWGVSREDRIGTSRLMHYLADATLYYRF